MRYYLFATLCFCLTCKLHAQDHYSDSLKRLIDERKVDSIEKINTLLLLAKYYQQTVSQYDSARAVLDQAIAEANRIKATELLIDATFNKGVLLYYSFENRAEGSLLYQKSYELAIKYDHPNKLSRIFYGLGIANDHIKDHLATEDYFLKAYDYAVKFNNDIDKSKAIRALGAYYKARRKSDLNLFKRIKRLGFSWKTSRIGIESF